MSCSCSYGSECIGIRISGPHIARKPGFTCDTCGNLVEPGQRCVDAAGLYADDYGGFFGRQHDMCWHLTQRFKMEVCGYSEGESTGGGDLYEMAEHAMAHSDEPYWADWLLIYEMAWDYLSPLGEAKEHDTCENCTKFAFCQRKVGVTRFTDPWSEKGAPCPDGKWSFEKVQGKD